MKRVLAAAVFAAMLAFPSSQFGLPPQRSREEGDREPRLPNGKSQNDAILKADHEKSLKDAAELIELAEALKLDLEKNDRHVLSLSSLKKTEEIEKIVKRIRSRLKRF